MNSYESITAHKTVIIRAQQTARAINHAVRLNLLDFLQTKGRATVTEIYIYLRCDQSVASQQLCILKAVGIVKPERDGKFVYYSIDDQVVATTLAKFSQFN